MNGSRMDRMRGKLGCMTINAAGTLCLPAERCPGRSSVARQGIGRGTMKLVTVTIPEKAVTVGSRIGLADTSLSRLFGLLGKSGLDPGSGILIRPSSGVHTMWMKFPIDVVALDRSLRVYKVWPNLVPWRFTSVSTKIHSVLELAPGQIEACRIEPGDQLAVEE